MKRLTSIKAIIILCFVIHCNFASGQQLMGMHGLLNTPDARMNPDGSLAVGVNYLPNQISPDVIKKNSMNYYASICFLPFLELSYRCTILDPVRSDNFFEHQDRSIGGKLLILNEKKITPSLAIGSDDIYTTVSNGNKHFSNTYIVASKRHCIGNYTVELSLGYGFFPEESYTLKGFFGGMALSLKQLNFLRFMIDYDSNDINFGGSIQFLKHINIYGFLYRGKYPTGGIEVRMVLGE